jgi:hypothetical protein
MADEFMKKLRIIEFCGRVFGYKNNIYLIFDSGT